MRKAIVFIGIILGFIGVYVGTHAYFTHLVTTPHDATDNTRRDFVVEEGSSAARIADLLVADDLISSAFVFTTYVRQQELDTKFVAGTFVLRRDQTIADIVTTLTAAPEESWITILEGWRAREIADYLAEKGYGNADAFMACVMTCTYEYDFLASKPADQGLEGYLFPDTYIITADAAPRDIIARMLTNFDQKVTSDLRQAATEQGRTLHEIITMASIIEREVRGDDERALVSGILWKRYDEGMGLGADATVLYALGDWKAPLTRDALSMDSPYNTRKFRDLPPGPIASPSLSSIRAAIHPVDSEYWYYLNTMDTGEVKYGRSLDEHNENVARYLR